MAGRGKVLCENDSQHSAGLVYKAWRQRKKRLRSLANSSQNFQKSIACPHRLWYEPPHIAAVVGSESLLSGMIVVGLLRRLSPPNLLDMAYRRL